METRQRRSVKRIDYRVLADVRVPKRVKSNHPASRQPTESSEKLYRLEVLESDATNKLVKVRYIGYDSSYDEWRPATDIIDLTEDTISDSSHLTVAAGSCESFVRVQPSVKNFSLFEELRFRIKSLLVSTRKGDPNCCVSMPFDEVHFEGLIRRRRGANIQSISILYPF